MTASFAAACAEAEQEFLPFCGKWRIVGNMCLRGLVRNEVRRKSCAERDAPMRDGKNR